MPVIDPSLFIHRFCAKLDFGDKLNEVSMTALRFVQRMKRDWICHGRRPNGLVGAAILMAARYHGFKRTINQVTERVHVCDETIRKRILEFKQTKVAQLTREEFEKLDMEDDTLEASDPPAYKKSERLKKLKEMAEEEKRLLRQGKQSSNPEDSQIKNDKNSNGDQSTSSETQLMKRSPSNIHKESLSDIDDEEIDQYILTDEESTIKCLIWHSMHKDWLNEQFVKEQKKKSRKNSIVKKRKKTNKELVDAPNPVDAILNHSNIGKKINESALNNLFEEKESFTETQKKGRSLLSRLRGNVL